MQSKEDSSDVRLLSSINQRLMDIIPDDVSRTNQVPQEGSVDRHATVNIQDVNQTNQTNQVHQANTSNPPATVNIKSNQVNLGFRFLCSCVSRLSGTFLRWQPN